MSTSIYPSIIFILKGKWFDYWKKGWAIIMKCFYLFFVTCIQEFLFFYLLDTIIVFWCEPSPEGRWANTVNTRCLLSNMKWFTPKHILVIKINKRPKNLCRVWWHYSLPQIKALLVISCWVWGQAASWKLSVPLSVLVVQHIEWKQFQGAHSTKQIKSLMV